MFRATDALYGVTGKEFTVVECRTCRLLRLSPRPTPLELRYYYPPEYWHVPESDAASRFEERYRRFVLARSRTICAEID